MISVRTTQTPSPQLCTYQYGILPHYPPLGQWVEEGGDLTKEVIKCPTIGAPPNPFS